MAAEICIKRGTVNGQNRQRVHTKENVKVFSVGLAQSHCYYWLDLHLSYNLHNSRLLFLPLFYSVFSYYYFQILSAVSFAFLHFTS